jgi:hypothetical protein
VQRNGRNFGDEISPIMLEHFAELTIEWSPPEDAQIVSAGSVIDVLPAHGWRGTVAGSGKLHEEHHDLTEANVVGLRGHLTRQTVELARRTDLVIGDPGLLAAELVPVERERYELGVVPHWSDHELYRRELAASKRHHYARPRLIDVTRDPLEVIAEIGSCRKIVSSSLHGLIVADSFGIPRRAERFPKMGSRWEGDTFKFDDYASALDRKIEWGRLTLAPMHKVIRIKAELFDMFRELNFYV